MEYERAIQNSNNDGFLCNDGNDINTAQTGLVYKNFLLYKYKPVYRLNCI